MRRARRGAVMDVGEAHPLAGAPELTRRDVATDEEGLLEEEDGQSDDSEEGVADADETQRRPATQRHTLQQSGTRCNRAAHAATERHTLQHKAPAAT